MNESLEIHKPASAFSKNITLASNSALNTSRFSNASALDKLSHILSQNLRLDQIGDLKGNIPTIPINDLRGNEAGLYSREERLVRCKLASLYRLLDIHGWTQSIYNHISVRCSKDHFLINPFGLLYHEVQASSLVKIDSNGNIIDPGSTVLGINRAGWTLHSALHSFRAEVDCVVHVHLPDVIAVSCLKAGLLPICPEATELINHAGVKYHNYQGILVDEKERTSIQNDLGTEAKVLFLRNHGVVIAAKSVAEAWYLLKRVITSCQVQVRLLQQGGGSAYLKEVSHVVEKINESSPAVNGLLNGESNGHIDSTKKVSRRPFDGVQNGDSLVNGNDHEAQDISIKSDDLSEWSLADKEFEAQMRILDSAGFCTGHQYRQPNLLRRGHYGPLTDGPGTLAGTRHGPGALTWGGDSTMHGTGTLDVFSDRTSATGADLSGPEDYVASATSAGQQHLARINESVRAQKQKSGRAGTRNGMVGAEVSKSNTLDSMTWDLIQTSYEENSVNAISPNSTRSTIPAKQQGAFLTDTDISSSTPMKSSSIKPGQKNGLPESVNGNFDRTGSLPQGAGKIRRFGSLRGFSFRNLTRKNSSIDSSKSGGRSSKTLQYASPSNSKGKKEGKKSKNTEQNHLESSDKVKPSRSFRSVFSSKKDDA